jgi:hypothetical protein
MLGSITIRPVTLGSRLELEALMLFVVIPVE